MARDSEVSHNPGLYIHVPFCRSKCGYCTFYSVTSVDAIPDYVRALCKEMEMYHGLFDTFDTVYLGGGTPSVLPPRAIEEILTSIRKNFTLKPDSEITIEGNPQDLDIPMLTSLFECGINRLSIGVQSFNDDILSFLGRRHTAATARSVLDNARHAGFTNIGIDLMYGIPGQSIQQWFETLEEGLRSSPEHLSCYELTVDADTPLGKQHQSGIISLPDEELQSDFFLNTSETLEDAGYVHYEVSNFARDLKCSSRHNRKYWNHVPYLGLGPAAHSFLNNRRWWNHRSLPQYISDIRQGKTPVEETEHLTSDELKLEAFSLGLRTQSGINLSDFKTTYGADILSEKKDIIATLVDAGLVIVAFGRLYPTRHGMAVADSLSLI